MTLVADLVPFQKVFEIDRYLSQPRIECLLCGRSFGKLWMHLRAKHYVTEDEYRDALNIPHGWGLVGQETREKLEALQARTAAKHPSMFTTAELRARLLRTRAYSGFRVGKAAANVRKVFAGAANCRAGHEYADADFAAVIKAVHDGKSLAAIRRDRSLPSGDAVSRRRLTHPAFAAAFDAAVEGAPFEWQSRAGKLGRRFQEYVERRHQEGATNRQICDETRTSMGSVSRALRHEVTARFLATSRSTR